MHISPCPGKVHVTEDRKCAGVGASIAIPGIVDNQDACDQVSWHLHTHAKKDQLKIIKLNIVSTQYCINLWMKVT